MNKPPTHALIATAVLIVLVTMAIEPWARRLADLPLWFDLLAHLVFCFRFGVMCGRALIDAADRGQP